VSSDASAALTCSFCGRNEDQVRKLLAGPVFYICDGCVEFCTDILAEECDEEDRGQVASDGETHTCSFCGKDEDQVRKLIASSGVYICDECIERCNDIIRRPHA